MGNTKRCDWCGSYSRLSSVHPDEGGAAVGHICDPCSLVRVMQWHRLALPLVISWPARAVYVKTL